VRYKPKDFKQRRRDDNGKWVWNLQGITRVPYNLPEVVKADLVVIPEGEKDVETLRSVGVVGSCNPGGAGKWRPEYNQHFTGKDVVILPDNDELGREHAEQVAGYLKPVAKTVKIVKLPGLQPKGDASDWLRGGHSAFDLAFESDHTPIWTKPEKKTGEDKAVELDFNLTDAGSAECFKRLFGHDYAFVRENKKWFRFDGNRWVQDDEVVLKMLGTVRIKGKQAWEIEDPEKRKVVLKWCLSSESRIKLAAGLSIAESMLPKSITAFDTDPMSVCCENGAIDLKTGCLFQPSRQQWLSKSVNLPYRPEAECPRWIRFLDEIFNGDGDLVSFVRKAVGYSLTGLTTEQVLFFLYGTGANGKSVFLNLIGDLLGDYAETTPASTWKDNPYHDGIPNDIARMVGARLVKSIEMKEGSRLNEERVKAMTGGDRVTARFLHNEFFEFTPVCKF
jgi:putative DNA primase/helicase